MKNNSGKVKGENKVRTCLQHNILRYIFSICNLYRLHLCKFLGTLESPENNGNVTQSGILQKSIKHRHELKDGKFSVRACYSV